MFYLVLAFARVYAKIFLPKQVLTTGALHHADPTMLRVAAARWHNELAPLPKPMLVVNIGGPTSMVTFCSFPLISLMTTLNEI